MPQQLNVKPLQKTASDILTILLFVKHALICNFRSHYKHGGVIGLGTDSGETNC